MKKIIITGGPTNEYIDEVMKITNMSTGSLSTSLGSSFLRCGYKVCLILNRSVYTDKLMDDSNAADNLAIVPVETTEEMMSALEKESKKEHTDIIIHAAAVGDYKADYTFLLEDLSRVLWNSIKNGEIESEADILNIMCKPELYQIDNSSKISSYQKNLTVKLGLTPKIIGKLREWYPDALLIGCKLLENVSKDELYQVAQKLCQKNDMNYILANDLAELRNGKSARYLVNKDGFTGTILETPKDIFNYIENIISE